MGHRLGEVEGFHSTSSTTCKRSSFLTMRKFGFLGRENNGGNCQAITGANGMIWKACTKNIGRDRSRLRRCRKSHHRRAPAAIHNKNQSLTSTASIGRNGVISIVWDMTSAIVPHDAEVWVPWRGRQWRSLGGFKRSQWDDQGPLVDAKDDDKKITEPPENEQSSDGKSPMSMQIVT